MLSVLELDDLRVKCGLKKKSNHKTLDAIKKVFDADVNSLSKNFKQKLHVENSFLKTVLMHEDSDSDEDDEYTSDFITRIRFFEKKYLIYKNLKFDQCSFGEFKHFLEKYEGNKPDVTREWFNRCQTKSIFRKIKNNKRDLFTSVHNFILDVKVHYPMYKLNLLFDMFYSPKFEQFINQTGQIFASQYKTFKRVAYTLFADLNRVAVVKYSSIQKTEIGDSAYLYPFQARLKGYTSTPRVEYKVKEIIELEQYIDDERCWKYIMCENFCARIKPVKVCIVESDTRLPHQDIMVDIFAQDYMMHHSINIMKHESQSYIGLFKVECITKSDYKKHPIFDDTKNLLQYDLANVGQNLLHTDYIYNQLRTYKLRKKLKTRYVITDKITHLFNQKSYPHKFLDSVFNPPQPTEPKDQSINVLLTEPELGEETGEDGDVEEIEPEPEPKIEPTTSIKVFNFCYNRHFKFAEEKNIIELAIHNLLNTNEKAKCLFGLYTDINVLKPIGKCYTNRRYFNVILYNKVTKAVSQSYHAYLDENDVITSITRIENLI